MDRRKKPSFPVSLVDTCHLISARAPVAVLLGAMIPRRMERPLVLANPMLPSLPRFNHPQPLLLLQTGQKSPLKSGFPSGSRASNRARFGFIFVIELSFILVFSFNISRLCLPFPSLILFLFAQISLVETAFRTWLSPPHHLKLTNCRTRCCRREGCLWRACFHACASSFLFPFFFF